MKYKFKTSNMTVELSEPTIEAFRRFYEEHFLNIILGEEIQGLIERELTHQIDNKLYEVIGEEDE